MPRLEELKHKLKNRSHQFALKVVYLYKDISLNYQESYLANKLISSGTEVGELVIDALTVTTRVDFMYYLAKAHRQIAKSQYWLELLHESGYIQIDSFNALNDEVSFMLRLIEELQQSNI